MQRKRLLNPPMARKDLAATLERLCLHIDYLCVWNCDICGWASYSLAPVLSAKSMIYCPWLEELLAESFMLQIAKWNASTDNMRFEIKAALLRTFNAISLHDRPIPVIWRVLDDFRRCNERKAKRILDELLSTGEITIEDGCIVNRRAVDEASTFNELRVERQSAGRQGGIESGKSRRKALKDNDQDEAPASTREEKRRI